MIEFLKEFLQYAKNNKKLWMLPFLLFFIFIGLLVTATSGTILAPFVYTLF